MKKYFKLTAIGADADPKVTHMRVDLHYSKGGMNVWTYKQEPRGYYLTLQPVFRDRGMEGFTAFSGKKYILHEVTRASAKQEREAEQEANSFLADTLEHIARGMGYALGEECNG